ncbi:MAG: FapA family protein [Firmicutes bacterium]|jgi:RNA polymerase sigma factor (sigma-70 family)|nr:FapA family protein [Bacillota bacterium]
MRERTDERTALWREYLGTRDQVARSKLIGDSAGVLKWAVERVALDLPPGIDKDALLDLAIQEMFKVLDGPVPRRSIQFDSYLASRVRKAVLDGLRRSLGSDASIFRVVGPLLYRCAVSFRESGSLPGPAVILGKEPSSAAEEERLLAEAAVAVLLLTSNLLTEEGADDEGFAGALAAAIDRLPAPERTLIALYHYEELTISEISRVLKRSRRAVSALFTLASVHVLGQVMRAAVAISRDKMEAELRVYPWADGPRKGALPDRRIVDSALRSAGVIHGVDGEAVQRSLVSRPGEPHIVARGTPAKDGEDGRLIRLFEADEMGDVADAPADRDPSSWPGGWVKGRVRAGERLLRVVPPTAGVAGMDVTGAAVPAVAGAAPSLFLGENVECSADGSEIRARSDGQAWFDGEFVEVVPVLELPEVPEGHTERFDGTVVVAGVIRGGSRVFAGWDVVAERIEGAAVTAGGDVTIRGGIVGCDHHGVRAGGNVASRFVEASRVRVGGRLRVNEYIVHSTVEASAGIEAASCWVCGGQIASGTHVSVGLAGGELGTRTVIAAGERRLVHETMIALTRVLGDERTPSGGLLERFSRRMVASLGTQPAAEESRVNAESGVRAGVTLSVAGRVKFVAEDVGPGTAALDTDGSVVWRSLRVH